MVVIRERTPANASSTMPAPVEGEVLFKEARRRERRRRMTIVAALLGVVLISAVVVALVVGGTPARKATTGTGQPLPPAVASTLTGRVLEIGGPAGLERPWKGTTVTVTRGNQRVTSAVTDSDGKFTVRVPPGEYNLSVVESNLSGVAGAQGPSCKTTKVHVTAGVATLHDLACQLR